MNQQGMKLAYIHNSHLGNKHDIFMSFSNHDFT